MVKINLLDIPEEQKSSAKRRETHSETLEPRGPMDFSFFQNDEEAETPRTPGQQASYFEEVDNKTGQQYTFPPQEDFRSQYSAATPAHEPGLPKSRLFILGGIVLITIVLLLVYLFYFNKEDETPNFLTDTPNVEQNDVANTPLPASSIPGYLESRYASNQAQNDLHLNYADNILNISVPNTGYSLAVFTPGYIYLSVLGDSRDAIAAYRTAMKSQNPQLNLTLETTEEKYLDGQKKLLADFSIIIASSQAQGRGAGQFRDVISAQQVQDAVRSVAQKNQLRTTYFKEGNQETEGTFVKTFLYTRVSGGRSSIIQYLNELSQQYPAIHLAKISMYPTNAGTMNGGNTNAHIEMVVYGPR